MNKLKIINDPVYGFITIPYEIIFDLMEHPWFQRLRRINQLGMTQLVYPGAIHTRFHHAIGALHLMTKALDILEQKGISITEEEKKGACIAILLHDIGHGPFSHVLENILLPGVHHETVSLQLMLMLNREFNGQLDLAIDIFNDNYPKKYLHQLISSQLDMDRLDYLTRDSFYTGVSEGIVGIDRIINMLAVHDNELVVEEKGIYSIEKFIIARRLMYWQVYLHKTTIAADQLLMNIVRRVKYLIGQNDLIHVSPELRYFLSINDPMMPDNDLLVRFNQLDDSDLIYHIKQWQHAGDFVLSTLCSGLINRKLPKILMQNTPFDTATVDSIRDRLKAHFPDLSAHDLEFFLNTGMVKNEAYKTKGTIKILSKKNTIRELAEASDNYNINALTETVTKHYISHWRI